MGGRRCVSGIIVSLNYCFSVLILLSLHWMPSTHTELQKIELLGCSHQYKSIRNMRQWHVIFSEGIKVGKCCTCGYGHNKGF